LAKMTEKFLKHRKELVLKNIKEDKIYDMEKHQHDEKRKRKDERPRI